MAEGVNLLVFRETRQSLCSRSLLRGLIGDLEYLNHHPSHTQSILDALIRTGELECALSDCASPEAWRMAIITDSLAALLLHSGSPCRVEHLLRDLVRIPLPETVLASPPEGFAYYALHPADFAQLAAELDTGCSSAIIGIRSIGTVLSAVWMAALQLRGTLAARITVRPEGHPYDRKTEFFAQQLRWIQEHRDRGSQFFVLDEGPGLSGSSFLSVAEALMREGIATGQITLVGTRNPDPSRLCATNAATRCKPFLWKSVPPAFYKRFHNYASLAGGAWRKILLNDECEWPPSWPQMERLKLLSPDQRQILKFEGFSRFGEAVRDRASRLHQAGFGPCARDAGDGLTSYDLVSGNILRRSALSERLLKHIARYCAFRAQEFRAGGDSQNQVAEMARFNLAQALGLDLILPIEQYGSENHAIVDGRMQPHEWVESADGTIFKVDGCSHGDDHLFPGPTDIAWDLAGTIVEWNLDPGSAAFFLDEFRRYSPDRPSQRLPAFLVAYGVFRLSYCEMASRAVDDPNEARRLHRSREFYRCRLMHDLVSSGYQPRNPQDAATSCRAPAG